MGEKGKKVDKSSVKKASKVNENKNKKDAKGLSDRMESAEKNKKDNDKKTSKRIFKLFKTPDEFEQRMFDYFDKCEEEGSPIILTGLLLALGIGSKQALNKYKSKEGYKDLVEYALTRIEAEYEKLLVLKCTSSAAIFALRDFDWSEKNIQKKIIPYRGYLGSVL